MNFNFLKKERPLGGAGKDTHLYLLIPRQVKLTHNYGPRASKTTGKELNMHQGSKCLVSLLPVLDWLPRSLVFKKQALCMRTVSRWSGSWRMGLDSTSPLEGARDKICLMYGGLQKKSKPGAKCLWASHWRQAVSSEAFVIGKERIGKKKERKNKKARVKILLT